MDFIQKTRRNHGLEHATISLLLPHMKHNRMVAGYSVPTGFVVLGDAETEQVEQAAAEALRRMQAGEADLAISPFCGTNIVVAALMTTIAVAVALRSGTHGLGRFNRAFSNATMALVASRPIGRMVQQRYTTSADVAGLSIQRVTRHQIGRLTLHWTATAFAG